MRKWDGEVGDKARALVKKWKELLPDSENTGSTPTSSVMVNGHKEPTGHRHSHKEPASHHHSHEEPTGHHHGHEEPTSHHPGYKEPTSHHHGHEEPTGHRYGHVSHKKKKKMRGRSGEGDAMHVVPTSHKSLGQLAQDGGLTGSSESDDFSRALMMEPTTSTASKRTRYTFDEHKHSQKGSQSKATFTHSPDKTFRTPSSAPQLPSTVVTSISTLTRPKSPPVGSFLDIPVLPGGPSYSPKGEDTAASSRKRKGKM